MENCKGDFDRLKGTTYVDWAGSALYGARLIDACSRHLQEQVHGNPHTQDVGMLQAARERVLNWFHAPEGEYDCVFTSGATDALATVAQRIAWRERQVSFIYTQDNHTSVVGVAARAAACGARSECVVDLESVLEKEEKKECEAAFYHSESGMTVTAFPAESNFNGRLYPLDWISRIQNMPGKCNLVLLDAAKFCATHELDLRQQQPDLVVVSWYKVFGYPTGLGCLLIRKVTVAPMLSWTGSYYGGGTVQVSIPKTLAVVPKTELHERLEHGTVNFLSIAMIHYGFDYISNLGGLRAIARHTKSVTERFVCGLRALQHYNGRAVCEIYGHSSNTNVATDGEDVKQSSSSGDFYGSTVAFSLKTPEGGYLGYAHVVKLARMHQIVLRSGCFCNPGACQLALGLSPDDVMTQHAQGHSCGDDVDLVDNRPTGCLRVSFGYGSSMEDCERVLAFLQGYFVVLSPPLVPSSPSASSSSSSSLLMIDKLVVYPIKSCQGMEVTRWPVHARGLLFDREFCLVNARNVALTQKAVPAMACVRVAIDLKEQLLSCECDALSSALHISLDDKDWSNQQEEEQMIHVCGVPALAVICTLEAVSQWFSECMGQPCRLARISSPSTNTATSTKQQQQDEKEGKIQNTVKNDLQIGFNNEGQYLLVSDVSIAALAAAHHQQSPDPNSNAVISFRRFRPNILVTGCQSPFEEDQWVDLKCDTVTWEVENKCTRCGIINVDPKTGIKTTTLSSSSSSSDSKPKKKPLFTTLARHRAGKAKITFGVLLRTLECKGQELWVGMPLTATTSTERVF